MGQLRQAHCPVGTKPTPTLRRRMLAPLLTGFTLSSVAVFATVSVTGTLIRSTFSLPVDLLVALALGLCGATDLLFPRIRPTLFNRQTPRTLSGRFSLPVTGLLWGLDAGTVVSTYRSSAASWAALILTFAGWGPWWTGIVYAVAFSGPLGLLIIAYPVTGGSDTARGWWVRSTESLVEVLGQAVKYVRLAAALTAVVGIGVAAQTAF